MSRKLSLPAWDARYPDMEILRHEVSSMVESYVRTLLDAVPNDHTRVIYLKGSSKKRWDAPIDYVPEASDIDIHLWFHDDDKRIPPSIALAQAAADYTCLDDLERAKCADLIDNASALPELPYRVIDRPGKRLAEVIRDLGYLVSPAALIVLQLDGIGVETAWSMNRTQATGASSCRGRSDFAAAEVIQHAETIANTHLDRRGLRTSQPLDNE